MTRTTDYDCYVQLVQVARALRSHGSDIGVALPATRAYASLRETAERMGVPICGAYDATMARLVLDHAPMGLGVRPMICKAGETGHHTPAWWGPSCGLGPLGVKRAVFVEILYGVANALGMAKGARKDASGVGGES